MRYAPYAPLLKAIAVAATALEDHRQAPCRPMAAALVGAAVGEVASLVVELCAVVWVSVAMH